MYQIDDALIYGSFGVCRVADITEREFCGSESLYYVLEPVFDSGCTFFVDVHNSAAASRLRPALEPEDAERLIAAMPGWKNSGRTSHGSARPATAGSSPEATGWS